MDNNIHDKLTNSARQALKETIDEVTEIIIEKAYQNANNNNTADKEISLRDIIEAKEEVLYNYEMSNFIHKESIQKRFAITLSIAGAVYTVLGILVYLFQNTRFDATKDLGIIITAIGILASTISIYYILIIRRKDDSVKDNIVPKSDKSGFEIVRRWQIIEKLGTVLMLQDGVSDDSAISFNQILNYLSHKLSAPKAYQLRKVLMARNQVVHNEVSMSKDEMEEMIKIADIIIDELEKQTNTLST